jgi:farnesyl diphosphate synthase
MTTGTTLPDFAKRLDQTAEDTEALLAKLLSDTLLSDEIARPKRLMDAMRYSTLGGGKRLRPFLVVESSAVFGVGRQSALLAGAALECIHCYSLIHDDLPAMDNSDLRRGRPTLHKKTDDATAILAGDGLLTLAFDIVTRDEIHNDPSVRLLLTRALARASGIGGMVGGQMLDLAGEGRFGDREPVDVARLQQMKTGALLRYGCIAGAILGQSSPKAYQALDDYGRALGEAFQIADDLLDVEGDAAALGKQTGQDAALGKTTFVTQLGLDGARQRVPMPRSRSSAPKARCCAPPPGSSPSARTEARTEGARWRIMIRKILFLSAFKRCPSRSAWSTHGRVPSFQSQSESWRSFCCRRRCRW